MTVAWLDSRRRRTAIRKKGLSKPLSEKSIHIYDDNVEKEEKEDLQTIYFYV